MDKVLQPFTKLLFLPQQPWTTGENIGAAHAQLFVVHSESSSEKRLHINCLEKRAVELCLEVFFPYIKGHYVLVRSVNMSVVSYINRQGGLRSRSLYTIAQRLLVWAQHNLCSLRAAHVPGSLNLGPDRLSRGNVPPGGWSLHPRVVQSIWSIFGRAEVDLFASEDNAHCPIYFTKSRDTNENGPPVRRDRFQ
ncbi:unnamed protein product [Leuciscus chuanchicus]